MAILSLTANSSAIEDPELEASIKMLPGVVDSGLFCGFTEKTTVIVGNEKKCRVITSADIIA